MPPVADAVHLVDNEEPGAWCEVRQDIIEELLIRKTLWRYKECVDLVVGEILCNLKPVVVIRGVNGHDIQTGFSTCSDLVAHQCKQWRDNDGWARASIAQHLGCYKINGALTPTGSLNNEHALTSKCNSLDCSELAIAKLVVGSPGK
ncbi:unannotated protein [freshwater metagenome]|uniref:Unannotated protein n=1 Tax=freshwater metagenome TaxID=449393 RepID=A0A6J7DB05_9ZZZZ